MIPENKPISIKKSHMCAEMPPSYDTKNANLS